MKESDEEVFQVRDARGSFLWMDNEVVDRYAKIVGIAALSVYAVLCRHADNKTGQCFPSQSLIAEKLNVSISTIRRSVKALLEGGLIDLKRDGEGCTAKTIYTVLPVKKGIPSIRMDSPEKGFESLPIDGLIPSQMTTNKTQLTRLSNKPTPSAENLVLLESPDDGRTRFSRCRESLAKCYKYLNGDMAIPWDVSDAACLSHFLKIRPDITPEEFHIWLGNYATSLNINPTDRPRKILPNLDSYRSGPLNEYGRPLVEKKRRVL